MTRLEMAAARGSLLVLSEDQEHVGPAGAALRGCVTQFDRRAGWMLNKLRVLGDLVTPGPVQHVLGGLNCVESETPTHPTRVAHSEGCCV